MSKIDDGGPALPVAVPYRHTGMSLRDAFALGALVGFLSDGSQRLVAAAIEQDENRHLIQDMLAKMSVVNGEIAGGCYAIADAMLAERAKVKP